MGVAGDMLLVSTALPYETVFHALMYAPVSIPNATQYLPLPLSKSALSIIGYSFWPLFAITTIVYFRKPSTLNGGILLVITAIGFFGIVHKYWAMP